MMLSAFLHGYLLAFGLILPLGPQNAFILSQGAGRPRWLDVLPAVLIACVCDTLLILLAVFGVSVIILTVPWFKTTLILAGVCFLVYIGWVNWRAAAGSAQTNPVAGQTVRQQVAFTLAVSLLNPHAILDTIGVIGTSALAYVENEKIVFALGCILNSCLWFSGLALAGRVFGNVRNAQHWLSRASALIMWISAVLMARMLLV
jgi:L-lysine exporter family protein LysE/ArgO